MEYVFFNSCVFCNIRHVGIEICEYLCVLDNAGVRYEIIPC
jgi:hypothetical protein